MSCIHVLQMHTTSHQDSQTNCRGERNQYWQRNKSKCSPKQEGDQKHHPPVWRRGCLILTTKDKKTLTNGYDLVLFTFRFSWFQKSVTSVSSIPGSTTQWRVRRDQCHSHTTVVKPCPHSSEQLPTEAQQNYLTRQQRQIGQGAEAKTIALMLSLDNQLVGKLPTLNSTRERLKEH